MDIAPTDWAVRVLTAAVHGEAGDLDAHVMDIPKLGVHALAVLAAQLMHTVAVYEDRAVAHVIQDLALELYTSA